MMTMMIMVMMMMMTQAYQRGDGGARVADVGAAGHADDGRQPAVLSTQKRRIRIA
jgi:hypothetical protein